MRTLVLDPPTAGLNGVLENRRRSGLDRMDEIWEGVYHMVPAPSGPHSTIESRLHRLLGPLADSAGLTMSGQCNIGESEQDFRVPDGALHRSPPTGVWNATAALAIEVVSPGDESWEKLPFYAAHRVDEVLIVDPRKRTVDWLALGEDGGDEDAGESESESKNKNKSEGESKSKSEAGEGNGEKDAGAGDSEKDAVDGDSEGGRQYVAVERSRILATGPRELAEQIGWPAG